MRHVSRRKHKAPSCLDALDKKGLDERTRALAYYSARLPATAGQRVRSFSFKAYSHADVRTAIETLFSNKCAYCDSRYDDVHPVEVEHWRPKAEVRIEGKDEWHFGYYWLASSWDNLLPACIDCNRERYHRDIVTGKRTLLGKKNWFPVADERRRWRDPTKPCKEDPLLLNPCVDRPSEFLGVNDEGVMTVKTKDPGKHLRASASIRHYALNRPGLVSSRRRTIQLIERTVASIRSLLRALADLKRAGLDAEYLDEEIAKQFDYLENLAEAGAPHSFIAEKMVSRFRKEIRPSQA